MNILIAAEDSSFAEALIDFLGKENHRDNLKLQLVHVVEPFRQGYYADLESFEAGVHNAEQMVARLAEYLQTAFPRAEVKSQVIVGNTSRDIVVVAREMPADLIILGSHGRGVLGRLFLGSVSLAVNASAPCSVLTLRQSKRSSVAGSPVLIRKHLHQTQS